MSNYKESKKQLDVIKRKYCCKGDIIFRSAIQIVVEYGQCTILDKDWYKDTLDDINAKHDNADREGKWLFMTRDFEISIFECAKELSEINSYDLLIYIQKEVWLGGGEVGEPDYQRAIEIIKGILSTEEYYCEYCAGGESFVDKLEEFGLDDSEICFFGYEKYLNGYEENEEDE